MRRKLIDFENGKVSVLFRRILLPTLLGTVSLSAVTAMDGIFVGHGVGADGVAAVNIVVPMYQIMSGIGLMIGAGCSVVSSIHLSQQKLKVACVNITQAIVASSLLMFIFCMVVLLFPTATARILGSSETLMPQVLSYLKWIMPSFLFQMWCIIGLFIIRLDGSPRFAMWCDIIPAILNTVLDWLFIFPLGMGVKGAAIATSISLITGGIMAFAYLSFYAKTLKLVALKISLRNMLFMIHDIYRQCKIGSSSMLGELTLAVLIYMGNLMFMHYLGDPGVGAFGIVCYYIPFFFMIGNAIAQSAQPIISYNYGIKRWGNIIQARRLLFGTSIGIGIAVTILFMFFPHALVWLFVDTQSEAGQIAIHGFPYFATGVSFFVLNVAIIGYYQSIEKIRKATLFVFLRGFLLLLPAFIFLPQWIGIDGLWLAMPVTEIATLLVICFMWKMK
jgi:Na+-driven multidrug efflux pump